MPITSTVINLSVAVTLITSKIFLFYTDPIQKSKTAVFSHFLACKVAMSLLATVKCLRRATVEILGIFVDFVVKSTYCF